MIAGLDSATPPTGAQVVAARAAGVRLWSGYLATQPNVNLLRPWSQAEFDVARAAGSTPVAFCSGWDDPVGVRDLAAAWNVRPCLDVEAGIRPDGLWVQPWLDASGAGLYGGAAVHWGRRAAFHIMAAYPGYDPGATWPTEPVDPPSPAGWQWQGDHQEFGAEVDRGWYDDWFGGDPMLDPNDPVVQQILGWLQNTTSVVDAVGNTVKYGPAQPGDLGGSWAGAWLITALQAAQAPQLAQLEQDVAAIRAALARIETGLRGA